MRVCVGGLPQLEAVTSALAGGAGPGHTGGARQILVRNENGCPSPTRCGIRSVLWALQLSPAWREALAWREAPQWPLPSPTGPCVRAASSPGWGWGLAGSLRGPRGAGRQAACAAGTQRCGRSPCRSPAPWPPARSVPVGGRAGPVLAARREPSSRSRAAGAAARESAARGANRAVSTRPAGRRSRRPELATTVTPRKVPLRPDLQREPGRLRRSPARPRRVGAPPLPPTRPSPRSEPVPAPRTLSALGSGPGSHGAARGAEAAGGSAPAPSSAAGLALPPPPGPPPLRLLPMFQAKPGDPACQRRLPGHRLHARHRVLRASSLQVLLGLSRFF